MTENGDSYTASEFLNISEEIPQSGGNGSTTGKSELESASRLSNDSAKPLNGLSRHWRKPKDVNQLARQVTKITVMLLNGEIDLETARAYSALVRGVGQLKSIEVARARAAKEEPDTKL